MSRLPLASDSLVSPLLIPDLIPLADRCVRLVPISATRPGVAVPARGPWVILSREFLPVGFLGAAQRSLLGWRVLEPPADVLSTLITVAAIPMPLGGERWRGRISLLFIPSLVYQQGRRRLPPIKRKPCPLAIMLGSVTALFALFIHVEVIIWPRPVTTLAALLIPVGLTIWPCPVTALIALLIHVEVIIRSHRVIVMPAPLMPVTVAATTIIWLPPGREGPVIVFRARPPLWDPLMETDILRPCPLVQLILSPAALTSAVPAIIFLIAVLPIPAIVILIATLPFPMSIPLAWRIGVIPASSALPSIVMAGDMRRVPIGQHTSLIRGGVGPQPIRHHAPLIRGGVGPEPVIR